jgi:hypothetical protein
VVDVLLSSCSSPPPPPPPSLFFVFLHHLYLAVMLFNHPPSFALFSFRFSFLFLLPSSFSCLSTTTLTSFLKVRYRFIFSKASNTQISLQSSKVGKKSTSTPSISSTSCSSSCSCFLIFLLFSLLPLWPHTLFFSFSSSSLSRFQNPLTKFSQSHLLLLLLLFTPQQGRLPLRLPIFILLSPLPLHSPLFPTLQQLTLIHILANKRSF